MTYTVTAIDEVLVPNGACIDDNAGVIDTVTLTHSRGIVTAKPTPATTG
jgi:hypothetical protein